MNKRLIPHGHPNLYYTKEEIDAMGIGDPVYAYTSVSAGTYEATISDSFILCNTGGGTVYIKLPDSVSSVYGKRYTVYHSQIGNSLVVYGDKFPAGNVLRYEGAAKDSWQSTSAYEYIILTASESDEYLIETVYGGIFTTPF